MHTHIHKLFALVRAHDVVAKSAAARATPLWVGILLVAAVLFGPSGMRAADVTSAMHSSHAVRLALWVAWVVASFPAVATLFHQPSVLLLRTLPIPRWHFWLVHFLLLAVLETPWILLFLRGEGVLESIAAGAGAMAAHGLLLARSRKVRDRVAAVAVALVILAPIPAPLAALVALAISGVGVVAAWTASSDGAMGHSLRLVRGPAPVALALAHAASALRGDSSCWIRAVLLCVGSAAGIALIVTNNRMAESEHLDRLIIAIGSCPISLACRGFVAPLLRDRQRAAWLLNTIGVSSPVRTGADVLAVSSFGIACGLLFAGSLIASLHTWNASTVTLSLAVVAVAACHSLAVWRGSLWAVRGGPKDTNRLVGFLLLWISLSTGLGAWLGLYAIVPFALLGAGWTAKQAFLRSEAEREVMP